VKKLKAFLTLGLALCAGSAFAQAGLSGLYVTGGIGQGKAKFDTSDFSDEPGFERSFDDKDMTWNIGVGYRFHRNIAVELGYANLGEYQVSYTGTGATAGDFARDDYEVTAWKLAAVGLLPVVQQLSVIGKLGIAATKVDDEFTASSAGVPESGGAKKTRTQLFWGVGAQYDFTRNVGLRLEYENYGTVGSEFDDDNGTGRAKVSTFNLNLLYSFQ
jgi:OOP family OmpA-OmpF porin